MYNYTVINDAIRITKNFNKTAFIEAINTLNLDSLIHNDTTRDIITRYLINNLINIENIISDNIKTELIGKEFDIYVKTPWNNNWDDYVNFMKNKYVNYTTNIQQIISEPWIWIVREYIKVDDVADEAFDVDTFFNNVVMNNILNNINNKFIDDNVINEIKKLPDSSNAIITPLKNINTNTMEIHKIKFDDINNTEIIKHIKIVLPTADNSNLIGSVETKLKQFTEGFDTKFTFNYKCILTNKDVTPGVISSFMDKEEVGVKYSDILNKDAISLINDHINKCEFSSNVDFSSLLPKLIPNTLYDRYKIMTNIINNNYSGSFQNLSTYSGVKNKQVIDAIKYAVNNLKEFDIGQVIKPKWLEDKARDAILCDENFDLGMINKYDSVNNIYVTTTINYALSSSKFDIDDVFKSLFPVKAPEGKYDNIYNFFISDNIDPDIYTKLINMVSASAPIIKNIVYNTIYQNKDAMQDDDAFKKAVFNELEVSESYLGLFKLFIDCNRDEDIQGIINFMKTEIDDIGNTIEGMESSVDYL